MRERKGLSAPVPDPGPATPPTTARPRSTAVAGSVPDPAADALSLRVGSRSWPLVGTRLLVGRAGGEAEAQVEVEDPSISRRHAEIVATGATWVLRDLGSTNGTWLGDRKLSPGESAAIAPGMAIRFGSMVAGVK